MTLMQTETFRYADDTLRFIEELLYNGHVGQFQVAWHNGTREWMVSYPPVELGLTEQLGEAEDEAAE